MRGRSSLHFPCSFLRTSVILNSMSRRKMETLSPEAKQAEQLKNEGNFCFSKDRFGAAIEAYTEVLFPSLLFP